MHHVSTKTRLAVAIVGALLAGNAAASGYQVRESSTKNAGRANASLAVSNDASAVHNNPAAMVNTKSATVQADVAVIDLNATFTGSACTPTQAGCLPVSGGNGNDPGKAKAVPAIAVVVPMKGSLEGLSLGASITAPFGLGTSYDPKWVGRYNTIQSDVKAIDLTLSAAVQITPKVSAGIGLIYQRAEVKLSNALDFGAIMAKGGLVPAASIGKLDGSVEISGSDNDFGFVGGVQFTPVDTFKLGYSYRSEIRHRIKGTADFTTPPELTGAQPGLRTRMAAAAAAIAQMPAGAARDAAVAQYQQGMVLANGFADTAGTATFYTPAVHTFSAEADFTNDFRMYFQAQRTMWSAMRNVTIDFGNPYQPRSVEPFNWKNTWSYAMGAEYDISDAFTLRGGVARDVSPTNNRDRTPRLPDNDRTVFALGATWNATPHLAIDAALTRIKIASPTVNATSSSGSVLTGKFDGHANIYGVGVSYKF